MLSKVLYAFIDSQNLNLGVRTLGWELDFKKFSLYLKNKYNVEKAYLFIGYIEGNNKLYEILKSFGYILIFKPTLIHKEIGKSIVKGNVDAELVLHTIINLNKYNKAIIISGDGDFYCLIEYLEIINKLEKVITPNNKYSRLLKKYQKYIFVLADAREVLKK